MKKIATIGIFAHANAGKTTLTENLLYKTGVLSNIGRVDNGNTVTDNLLIEKSRGISVRAGVVTFDYGDKHFQLIDTPGHVDFSAEVVRAVNTLDIAILVLSGVEGIEPQTNIIWNLLQKRNIPTVFFVNKLDRKGADFNKVINQIKSLLTPRVFVFNKPMYAKDGLCIVENNTEQIIEEISNYSDIAMEYAINRMEDGVVSGSDDVFLLLEKCIENEKIFPICCGSALISIGIDELLFCIDKIMPFKSYHKGNSTFPFSAYIYSISYSKNGKEVFAKILQGKINNRDQVYIHEEEQKIKSIYILKGNQRVPADTAFENEIVVLGGLNGVKVGDVIGEKINYNQISMDMKPMFTSKIVLLPDQDSIKAIEAFKCLNEEDSLLNIRYDTDSKNIQIDLMGELQSETIEALLDEKYNVKVKILPPQIIYKETPMNISIGTAGYKKCSNLTLEIIPRERGSGIVINSFVDTGVLTSPYQKQIIRLMQYYSKIGLHGWALTDAEINLIDGKYDHVGSETLHYNIAAPLAYMRALKSGGTILLEPTVEFEVSFKEEQLNVLYSEIIPYCTEYSILDSVVGYKKIIGTTKVSRIMIFANNLKRITNGYGVLTYYHKGYVEKNVTDEEKTPEGICYVDDPRNEEKFVQEKQGSMINLDKGINEKRGKPEKIKRNKRFWVNGRKPY